jgi:uncharacterized protein (DUF4415 family)
MRSNAKKEEQREDAEIRALIELTRIDMQIAELERRNQLRKGCPPGWRKVEAENPIRPRKVQITLRIDKEVAGWFWQQGQGYQSRINAVLRAYMLARRAEVV